MREIYVFKINFFLHFLCALDILAYTCKITCIINLVIVEVKSCDSSVLRML